MASKAVAKAAGGIVEISKVRRNTNWLPQQSGRGLRNASPRPAVKRRAKHTNTHDFPPCAVSNLRSANSFSLQKQTLQSTGVWERIRRAVAIDPNRSNGVPLNPYFRNPAPGALGPETYDDPVTTPSADIADNPYWKRDVRRAYPQLSVVTQADAVGLLSVGSAAAPKAELIGEAGAKQLVAAKAEGETGLAAFLEKTGGREAAKDVLVDGLPPLPSGQSLASGTWDVHKYGLAEENSYGDKYVLLLCFGLVLEVDSNDLQISLPLFRMSLIQRVLGGACIYG